ncbi:TetR/AcrR family transcriptional regulator [Paenibacillus beijingensis]|uniref:TetR/AcrR family transcriptional regulator n=1 Tax=Paenibacillus beijingensis TaxID=1126833 RepID=UPI000698D09A|nr:TetR/AcrR family transcriptional regulator [Paenibacillus beijingensis]
MHPEQTNRDTRAHILNTAKRLFLNTGYHKVSMRMLAKEAGISTGPLYFHFKNKPEVFYAICCEGLELLNADVSRAAAAKLPHALRLREIFLAFQNFYIREPLYSQIIRVSFNPLSGIEFNERQREALFAKKQAHMLTMKEVIREGIEKGELQNIDPSRFMLVLYTLGEGIFMANENGDLQRFGVSLEEMVQEASRLTYTGILSAHGGDR